MVRQHPARARPAQGEDDSAVFDQPVDLVQQLRDLLPLVHDDEAGPHEAFHIGLFRVLHGAAAWSGAAPQEG